MLLSARSIRRQFGRHTAVRELSLKLHRGEVLGLLGLNGAGKTTTLEMLAGSLAPDGGAIDICGEALRPAAVKLRRHIGYLPQTPPLISEVTVYEYLRYCAGLRGVRGEKQAQAIEAALKRCNLNDVSERLIRHLSGGYQQRTGLAQAIVGEPALIILDEPTSGLDPAQLRDTRELMRDLAETQTLIVSSHLLGEVRHVATRIAILHAGELVHDAPVSEHSTSTKVRFRNNPSREELEAVSGVTSAQQHSDGSWRLVATPEDLPQLAKAAVEQQWQLLELTPRHDDLERLFLSLTGNRDLSGGN